MSEKHLMTPQEAAPLLSALVGRAISVTSVRNLIARERLASVRRGRRVLVSRAAIADFLALWPERERRSQLRPLPERELP